MPLYDARPRGGSSKPWPTSTGQFMENMFLRKREVEHRRNALWDSTAKYFDRLQRQNKVFESWNTPESIERSSEAYDRARLAEAHKANLYDGPERPETVVRREERRFIEAVNSGIPFQGSKDMKRERAIFTERRRAEQKQEADEFMQQHWKINDPGFKDLQSRKSTAFLKLPTSDELHEARVRFKKDDEEEEESDEDKKIEDSRKFVEEETKFFDDNVQKHVEEIKETQLERWKDAIMKYIEDSKALRVKEEQIQLNLSKDLSLETCVTTIVEKMKKVSEKWKESDLDTCFNRQFRLKLHAKSCEVEKEIDENRRIVDELQNLLRFETEELSDIFSEATIFKDRLIHQKYEETQNRRELGLLFSEEASKMWLRQSQKWAEDRSARSGTFNTIIENLKEVLRIRIQSKKRSLQSCQSSRQSIDEAVEKLTQDLQHEEERERRRREAALRPEAALEIEDLECLNLQNDGDTKQATPPAESREDRFRNKNEVANRLAGWKADGSDKPEYGDFRRKKVKWFD